MRRCNINGMLKVLSRMSSSGEDVCGVSAEREGENHPNSNSRTDPFSSPQMEDRDRHGGYPAAGLELFGNGKRKTVAGKLTVHR